MSNLKEVTARVELNERVMMRWMAMLEAKMKVVEDSVEELERKVDRDER